MAEEREPGRITLVDLLEKIREYFGEREYQLALANVQVAIALAEMLSRLDLLQ